MYKNLPKLNDNSYVHFITTNTYENRPYFRNEEFCRVLLGEVEFYSRKFGFTLTGYVIMPAHLHLLLWWDTEERLELTVSKIMQGIKGTAARRIIDLMIVNELEQMLRPTNIRRKQIPSLMQENIKSHKRNLRNRLWQPGFHDFNIYSEEKLLEKLDYIHYNPVKAGMVVSPGDYKWSSFRFYFSEEKNFPGASTRKRPLGKELCV